MNRKIIVSIVRTEITGSARSVPVPVVLRFRPEVWSGVTSARVRQLVVNRQPVLKLIWIQYPGIEWNCTDTRS